MPPPVAAPFTEGLPQEDPVLILGGGLIGLAVAHALARRGLPVLVLSRLRREAAGFVAAGMLAPHAEGLCGPLLELGQRSLALIPAWVAQIEADSGLSCGLRPCGIVVPFATAAERDAFPTFGFGVPLDRPALEREIPGIGDRWRTGLLFPQEGQIDNRRRLMRALERACVTLGVRFEEGTAVVELLTSAGPAGANGGTGERLQGVRVRRAEGGEAVIPATTAVLACGAWSARLVPQLPVFPVKGQMLSLQGPRRALARVLFGPGTYLVPREDGLVVVGATSEPEAGFGEGLTPAGQKQLQAGIAALLPEAGGWPPMERWWGFRPCTPDQAPLLGAGPIAGLWLATGHHRNGVLLAAITAELLAARLAPEAPRPTTGSAGKGPTDGLTAEEKESFLQAFRWDRFDTGPNGA